MERRGHPAADRSEIPAGVCGWPKGGAPRRPRAGGDDRTHIARSVEKKRAMAVPPRGRTRFAGSPGAVTMRQDTGPMKHIDGGLSLIADVGGAASTKQIGRLHGAAGGAIGRPDSRTAPPRAGKAALRRGASSDRRGTLPADQRAFNRFGGRKRQRRTRSRSRLGGRAATWAACAAAACGFSSGRRRVFWLRAFCAGDFFSGPQWRRLRIGHGSACGPSARFGRLWSRWLRGWAPIASTGRPMSRAPESD